jgi:hypothetical protein
MHKRGDRSITCGDDVPCLRMRAWIPSGHGPAKRTEAIWHRRRGRWAAGCPDSRSSLTTRAGSTCLSNNPSRSQPSKALGKPNSASLAHFVLLGFNVAPPTCAENTQGALPVRCGWRAGSGAEKRPDTREAGLYLGRCGAGLRCGGFRPDAVRAVRAHQGGSDGRGGRGGALYFREKAHDGHTTLNTPHPGAAFALRARCGQRCPPGCMLRAHSAKLRNEPVYICFVGPQPSCCRRRAHAERAGH